MQKFPRAHIDPSQDIMKKIIDKHILFTDIPPHDKGPMWAVEYLQRIKAQLQNMAFGSRDYICARLRKAMHQPVTMLSELVTAGVTNYSALQDDICKHKLELELMEYELASMEQCAANGAKGTADVFQSKRAQMHCVGRRVQTGPRPIPSQDPCYEGTEVPQGSEFLSWPCDPLDGPSSIRNSNPEFQLFPGYRGLWNISHPD